MISSGGILNCCRRFLKRGDGATAVEFTLLAPIFFLIVLGLMEVGLFMYTNVAVESVVARAGREASIGNLVGGGATRSEQVRQMIVTNTRTLIGGQMTQVNTRVLNVAQNNGFNGRQEPELCYDPYGVGVPVCNGQYDDTDGDGIYDADTTANNAGGAEEVVEITVRLPWRANFQIVRDIFGPDGFAVIRASTIVKNEPFE
jgi:hypothetical protein